jgi:uncharacterized protein YdeI (YjbR/CyaY-like superfamily)
MKSDIPIKLFRTNLAWEKWLGTHHAKVPAGIWIRFYKKASGTQSITYAEALDVALCYGWIDGQKKTHDEDSWLQKFTPRRARSMWSKRNRDHVARLTRAKRMQPAGLAEVARAKADGRWDQAYDSPSSMTVPADFLKALAKDKKAQAFFNTLNKSNTYGIAWRLQTAKKPETRASRMQVLLEMMKQGKKLH